MRFLSPLLTALGLLLLWQAVVATTGIQPFILPAPLAVLRAWIDQRDVILPHAVQTLLEILLGFVLGGSIGFAGALVIGAFRPARRWLLPLLVVSQAVPVFALAPLLVLWLGYGMASKVAMAALIIFFPVTTSFFDGLRRTDPGWLDLARTMNGTRWRMLRHIRLPAALPALASGLRIAAAVAPIGAIIGEWVGSSAGLGFLMLQSNARSRLDLMFAALLTLAVLAVALYFVVDGVLRRLLPWQPESLPADD